MRLERLTKACGNPGARQNSPEQMASKAVNRFSCGPPNGDCAQSRQAADMVNGATEQTKRYGQTLCEMRHLAKVRVYQSVLGPALSQYLGDIWLNECQAKPGCLYTPEDKMAVTSPDGLCPSGSQSSRTKESSPR